MRLAGAQLSAQCRPTHSQGAGGCGEVAAVFLECLQNKLSFQLAEALAIGPFGALKEAIRTRVANRRGELLFPNHPFSKGGQAAHFVAKFTDVAGPGVAAQAFQGFRRKRANRPAQFLRLLPEKSLGQGGQVLRSFPQGRNPQREGAQSIVKVPAKKSSSRKIPEGLVGRAQDPQADGDLLDRSDAPDLTFVEGSQEGALHGLRHGFQLVEEERPSVGRLEKSGAVGVGARIGAPNGSEEFRLEDPRGQGAAVDGHETSGGSWAAGMQQARQKSLAGTRLALEQDRVVHVRQTLQRPEQAAHGGTFGHQSGERPAGTRIRFGVHSKYANPARR